MEPVKTAGWQKQQAVSLIAKIILKATPLIFSSF